jgi:hypothetical protein
MHRSPHNILSASCNLLGICFIVIGGLKLTNSNALSYADEIAWMATGLLFISILNSYLSVRNDGLRHWQIIIADWSFLGGLFCLMMSLIVGATYL